MMKKIVKLLLCFIILFTLAGCSNKKGMSASEFEKKLNNDGYYVSDITNENIGSKTKKVLIANNKKYQVEYYEYKDKTSCKDAYKSNKKLFKRYKKKSSKENETNAKDYDFYSLDLDDEYLAIARSGNTLIYTWANKEYKKDLQKLFKKLNY